ncbi:MAG: ribbon-helix-helix protein, CopG family [Candidatus Rokuibacteriota bacterium]
MLEPWQYGALKALAEREGVSISDMVRRILTRRLRPRSPRGHGLLRIAGIGRDRKVSGRDHDRRLYGSPPN